ncbi:uncharacterized protein RSE6_04285 [Rhynchosporium secalis]|uniref:Uncharacterized protein n=1 Tax=Rhynchosporium secalis TaxID=38038 RepID=A0A1E1M4Y1_RHYSE|nr:uncharacterized protein RSE6_04285 [Rhynchosporium secalis]
MANPHARWPSDRVTSRCKARIDIGVAKEGADCTKVLLDFFVGLNTSRVGLQGAFGYMWLYDFYASRFRPTKNIEYWSKPF